MRTTTEDSYCENSKNRIYAKKVDEYIETGAARGTIQPIYVHKDTLTKTTNIPAVQNLRIRQLW